MAFNWGGAADLIGAVGGLASGFLGGKNPGLEMMQKQWGYYQMLLDEAMKLYRTTDWEALDRKTLDDFKKTSMDQTETAIGNINAKAEASGYGGGFSDTEKTRTLGRISKEQGNSVASMEANLAQSRPQRQKGMLPDMGGVLGGFNAASQMDMFNHNLAAQEQEAYYRMFDGLQRWGKSQGRKTGASSRGGNGQRSFADQLALIKGISGNYGNLVA